MKIQQHDSVVVDAAVTAAGLHRSLWRRRRSWRGEGGARGMGCGCPPSPPLYIGSPRGGAGPGDPISQGGGGQGGWSAPQAKWGAPTPRVSNPRRRGRPMGGAPAH